MTELGIQIEQDYGGVYNIGDSQIKHFFRDERLAAAFIREISRGDAYPETSLDLSREWDANKSRAVSVSMPACKTYNFLYKTKKSQGDGKLHLVILDNPRRARTLDSISSWSCKSCPYGTSALPHDTRQARNIVPVIRGMTAGPVSVAPPRCLLDRLNDDILYEVASYLTSESVISFSQAWARFCVLMESSHELLRRELRCFFLRDSIQDTILGVGVALDPKSRTLSSDFDWLSEAAFEHHKVRRSVEKRDFQYFLPLAFNRPHFEKAEPKVWARLAEIDRALREAEQAIAKKTGQVSGKVPGKVPPPQDRHEYVRVLYRMMNNIIVSLMKSCDDVYSRGHGSTSNRTLLYASEKAVYSYCHLFHLLICLNQTTPQILRDALWKVQQFASKPEARVKAKIPDLGEFIVNITLVLALAPSHNLNITWGNVVKALLQELTARNVRWVLKESPELEIMEQGQSDYRLAMTFLRAKTSLRLMMFQVTFLDAFVKVYASDLSILDDNYGFAKEEIPKRIVEKTKEIYAVNTWPAFFARVDYTEGIGFGAEKFSHLLRSAVQTSAQRGYHNALRPQQVDLRKSERLQKESEWQRTRPRK